MSEYGDTRGLYLTRTIRVDGGFVREYYGAGPLARIMAEEFARERDHMGRSELWRKIRKKLELAHKQVFAFCAKTDVLLRATLLAAGYRNHRGVWRRRKPTGYVQNADRTVPTDLSALIKQAQAANFPSVVALQKYLKGHAEIW